MLKQIARLSSAVLSRPLPPVTDDERASLARLRCDFERLPVLPTDAVSASEAEWRGNMNTLRDLVLQQDPRRFLSWDVITRTMFIAFARYIAVELKYLKALPDWSTRWRAAIRESFVGSPTPYLFHPSTSANLIHHAYHLARFEEKSGRRIDDMDFVFEFGGGYGSLCRLFHQLGFQGRYLIYDLPPFSALQRYYLQTLGLSLRTAEDFGGADSGVCCLSDSDQLAACLAGLPSEQRRLFVATWSISETPLTVREQILPLVTGFDEFLIAYQDQFGEVDNLAFFRQWRQQVTTASFQNWRIDHLPGHSYLMGHGARSQDG